MDKYEISLWEDFPDSWTNPDTGEVKTFLNERKIAVIGSDTMAAQARALEPNLVEEINGSNTFTFKMYYTYTDNQTGKKYSNPFGKYLINERKVKVYWKDKWYDFVIKKCQEDSSQKSVTYTCKDLFINELSKQGYSLEFDTELQNNIGTASELSKQVLEGSTWMYDDSSSVPIIQKTEGPVYEVKTLIDFNATMQEPSGDTPNVTIPSQSKILVFYDSLINILNITKQTSAEIQFLYSEDGYQTDVNDMIVINGDCYAVSLSFNKVNNNLIASLDEQNVFIINLDAGVSNRYTAKRLVKSQLVAYEKLLDRYVLCYEDSNHNTVYGITTTEYTNPLAITNLIANPCNFTNNAGWIGSVMNFGLFPKFDSNTQIVDYKSTSYLKFGQGWSYNSGLQSNISYFIPNESEKRLGVIGGIQKNEKYVFRIKAKKNNSNNEPSEDYITDPYYIKANLYQYTNNFLRSGDALFTEIQEAVADNWIEYTFTATQSISSAEVEKYGIFMQSAETEIWVEEVQFFKYAEGATSYSEDAQIKRMNPGEINLQSIAVPVYKYYYPNDTIEDAKDMVFEYAGQTECEDYTPIYNNYEKNCTISEKESNRFNILQTIAETFQAWIRFRIDHEENGSIKIIDGVPQKYIYFVEELEYDNGLSFEYGIDLKTISRSIDSDNLATKIIVEPNNNEFADNGFCSIARSNENYCKENFILNFDYFIQQGLLNGEELNKDLYSIDENNIGYYYYLHMYNNEYDSLIDKITSKSLDLIRQNSQKKVYEQYLLAANQELERIEGDLINLANVNSWEDVQAYANSHSNNEKVQSLLNTYGKTLTEISSYNQYLVDINASIETLTTFINQSLNKQKELIDLIKQKHLEFNNKYTSYILEGTWQDDGYVDDNKYYLDALKVAYTSSRPQLSYTINVLRLSSLEEFSSKVFNLGDICYIQDKEFFGYLSDKITPYKEKILVSKISSFFGSPEKDVITVQNYKTRFDDLFQRIAATSQNLEYKEGSYQRAANSINTDGTIDFTILQDTFDKNTELVFNTSNQDVVWDDTGITVKDKNNSANKTKILAGGIFVTNDGGVTWKNAIRGDGISTDLLTAGRINTSQIYIYDGNAPTFRWDSYGLTAYSYEINGQGQKEVNFNKFVRYDKYGIYGYNKSSDNDTQKDFIPMSEEDIKINANFGLIWSGFFLKNNEGDSEFEISTDNDLIIKKNNIIRVQLGRLTNGSYNNGYGLVLRDGNGQDVFVVNTENEFVKMAGWSVAGNKLYYEYIDGENIQYTYLNANGVIEGGIRLANTQIYEPDWSIGPGGITINSDEAIISISGTHIDKTGVYTTYLKADEWVLGKDGLYYNDQQITPFNLNIGEAISDYDDLNILAPGIYEYTYPSIITNTNIIEQQNITIGATGSADISMFNYYNLTAGDIINITIDNVTESTVLAADGSFLVASTSTTSPIIDIYTYGDNCFCTSQTTDTSFTLSADAVIMPKNLPVQDSFKMSVMNINTEDCVVQTLYQMNSMNEYRRYYNGSNWSDWQCITGALTLDSACYGSALPSPGTVGRLFFVEIE